MNLFSISQLAMYSGIKAHTIRIWEQRYNALQPERSEGNTRYYDGQQLRRLLNIVSLSAHGMKISQLCTLPDKKLFSLVEEHLVSKTTGDDKAEYFIAQMIAAGMNYDEQHFEKIFSNCLMRSGIKDTYINVIYPMLSRIGYMWSADAIAPPNEHFISNLVKQKLYAAIDALPPGKKTSDKWLLFLPEGEFHELGLLLANFLIRNSGRPVIYLGSNVPPVAIEDSMKNSKCNNLLFFLVHNDHPEKVAEDLKILSKTFSTKKIYVSAPEGLLGEIKIPKNITWIKSVEELTAVL